MRTHSKRGRVTFTVQLHETLPQLHNGVGNSNKKQATLNVQPLTGRIALLRLQSWAYQYEENSFQKLSSN